MVKLIDANELLKQLGVSANFNAGIPPWVIGVIKGMKSPRCEDCHHWHNSYCYMFCQIRTPASLCDRWEERKNDG